MKEFECVYRAVFVYIFVGIVIEQRDVPAIVWTAAAGALAIAGMIALTWRQRPRRLAATTQKERNEI